MSDITSMSGPQAGNGEPGRQPIEPQIPDWKKRENFPDRGFPHEPVKPAILPPEPWPDPEPPQQPPKKG
jgi:hypothetical protein